MQAIVRTYGVRNEWKTKSNRTKTVSLERCAVWLCAVDIYTLIVMAGDA